MVVAAIILSLQMRRLRQREVKQQTKSYTAEDLKIGEQAYSLRLHFRKTVSSFSAR